MRSSSTAAALGADAAGAYQNLAFTDPLNKRNENYSKKLFTQY